MRRKRRAAAIIMAAVITCMMNLCMSCGGQTGTEQPGASQSGAGQPGTEKPGTGQSAKESGPEEEGSRKTAGICIYRRDDAFMELYCQELKTYLKEHYSFLDEDILVFYAEESQEEQDRQIARLTELPADVVIVNAVEESAVPSITDRCREAGIPVVYINRKPSEEELSRWEQEDIEAAWIGADAEQSGILQGEIILETKNRGDINGDGVVSYAMITGSPETSDAKERTAYAAKTLKDGGMRTRKLFEASGNWEREEGKQLAKEALGKYGRQIEVIFCNNDAMANGAREAILEARRSIGKDIYLVGVDALEDTVSYIKEGAMTGTVLNDYYGQAHLAADVAVKMADGEKTEKQYLVDYIKIAK